MFKLNAKLDADSLLYLLSHFESNNHTVHVLTQRRPPPPLTSEVLIVLACAFQSTPLGCQVMLMLRKLFSLYLTMVGLFLDRPCIYVCGPNSAW